MRSIHRGALGSRASNGESLVSALRPSSHGQGCHDLGRRRMRSHRGLLSNVLLWMTLLTTGALDPVSASAANVQTDGAPTTAPADQEDSPPKGDATPPTPSGSPSPWRRVERARRGTGFLNYACLPADHLFPGDVRRGISDLAVGAVSASTATDRTGIQRTPRRARR